MEDVILKVFVYLYIYILYMFVHIFKNQYYKN